MILRAEKRFHFPWDQIVHYRMETLPKVILIDLENFDFIPFLKNSFLINYLMFRRIDTY